MKAQMGNVVTQSLMHYRPWKGDDYLNGFRGGLKLLILGHSHYKDDSPNATVKWTQAHADRKPDKFWTHVEQVISGYPLHKKEERRSFWNKVAFSNFIQEALKGPDDKPTKKQWNRARQAFPEIITYTKPDIMFVFSTDVWSELPDEADYPGSCAAPGCDGSAYLYTLNSGYRFFAGVFAHPRNPRVDRIIWHAWSEFLFAKTMLTAKSLLAT